jgi:hypothetical protein
MSKRNGAAVRIVRVGRIGRILHVPVTIAYYLTRNN